MSSQSPSEEEVEGRVSGSTSAGLRLCSSEAWRPAGEIRWFLFPSSSSSSLALFLLFSQEPLGAWKYSNPSFLYCLAPLHRLASSCLEGWRCGHECCSSRCSPQISSSHFLLLIWLSLALSPCDFLSLSFPPSSVTSLWFSPLDIPLSFSSSSLYSLFSSAVLHIRS